MVNARHKKISIPLVVFFIAVICSSNKKQEADNTKAGTVKITFINTVKAVPLVLDSVEYLNPFGEPYRVAKLKYYISHVIVNNVQHSFAEPNSYHLIDETNPASLSFSFATPVSIYHSISFIVGVDSIKNVSGAQTDALDPANGMFWTWNSGYVFFKLEGRSTASAIINNKIEYHIGGYTAANNALRLVTLQLPEDNFLHIDKEKSSEIIITADLDKLWRSTNDIEITSSPAITTPGTLSVKIADNYSKMFTLKNVLNKYK
jgi:hypothetical protein